MATDNQSYRNFFFHRAVLLLVLMFFVAGGVSYRSEISGVFDFGSLKSSVTDPTTPTNNITVTATPEGGRYLKDTDFAVSLTASGPADLRYSIGQVPTHTSPLYPGWAIPLYQNNRASRTLYAIAIDGNLLSSRVFEFAYEFVPAPVTGLQAMPHNAGRVELVWPASDESQFQEYRVYVDGNQVGNSRHNAFTISGLSFDQHRFDVTVVDTLGAESDRATVFATPLPGGPEVIHSAAAEAENRFDLNDDGRVDVGDVEALLGEIEPSLEVLDAVIRWFQL